MSVENLELAARAALAWAIPETILKLPLMLRHPDGWKWDDDQKHLFLDTVEADYRFHVAAERRGARKVRIAVITITDWDGKVEWEADIPALAS